MKYNHNQNCLSTFHLYCIKGHNINVQISLACYIHPPAIRSPAPINSFPRNSCEPPYPKYTHIPIYWVSLLSHVYLSPFVHVHYWSKPLEGAFSPLTMLSPYAP